MQNCRLLPDGQVPTYGVGKSLFDEMRCAIKFSARPLRQEISGKDFGEVQIQKGFVYARRRFSWKLSRGLC